VLPCQPSKGKARKHLEEIYFERRSHQLQSISIVQCITIMKFVIPSGE
jgi:hypothetical protein